MRILSRIKSWFVADEKLVAILTSTFYFTNAPSKEYEVRYFLYENSRGKRSVEAKTTSQELNRRLVDASRNIKELESLVGHFDLYQTVVAPWLRGSGSPKIPGYSAMAQIETAAALTDASASCFMASSSDFT